MAPVFEPPPPDGDEEGEWVDEDVGGNDAGVVTAGKSVDNGEVPVGPSVAELETPINAPGPISGLSRKRKREGAGEDCEEDSYHRRTSIRWSPKCHSPSSVPQLAHVKDDRRRRTVTSMRAHWGTLVPAGIAFVKLWGEYSVVNVLNPLPRWETHVEGGSGLVQLIEYLDQLMAARLKTI